MGGTDGPERQAGYKAGYKAQPVKAKKYARQNACCLSKYHEIRQRRGPEKSPCFVTSNDRLNFVTRFCHPMARFWLHVGKAQEI